MCIMCICVYIMSYVICHVMMCTYIITRGEETVEFGIATSCKRAKLFKSEI